jgi:hypothetical protein
MNAQPKAHCFNSSGDYEVRAPITVVYFGEASAVLALILGFARMLPHCFCI